MENLDESDQFILGRDFIRNFDVTIDLNSATFRIRNPKRKYNKTGKFDCDEGQQSSSFLE